MSTVPVWQGRDAELLAELGAWKPGCIPPGRRYCRSLPKSIPGVPPRRWDTARRWNWCGRSRGYRGVRAQARVCAAADVLPVRGLNGAPVEPKLPATATAVAEHAIGAADVALIRSVLAR